MYTHTEKPKRDMVMLQPHPLAELLAKVYHTLLAVVFYSVVIGVVTLISYVITALVLRVLAQ
jgi:hypothetical protein